MSAYTQVKMEDAPKLLGLPESECVAIWIRLTRSRRPKSSDDIQGPVAALERNVYGHPWAGLLWELHFEKVLMENGWTKVKNLGRFFHAPRKSLVFSPSMWTT